MKTAIYIGRFQPFHLGHVRAIQRLQEQVDRVIVLVGSAFQPRTIKNPWTYDERQRMIEDAVFDGHFRHVEVRPLEDVPYNDSLWLSQVQKIISEFSVTHIGGFIKDESSYYLRMFPNLKFIDTGEQALVLDATDIRRLMFEGRSTKFFESVVPASTLIGIEELMAQHAFSTLKEEYEMIQKYKLAWAAAPYPPTFVTVDAVVVAAGHVLMVRRGAVPGRGSYALPGGFINQNEKLVDAAIRELREETNINIPDMVLRSRIAHSEVFDDPNRSLRGRTITHAFLIRLEDTKALPHVQGADDADEALWLPLESIRRNRARIYEDHFAIIQKMIGGSL